MRSDRKSSAQLKTLLTLQGLRVAEAEFSLADAQAAHKTAAATEEDATRKLRLQESELASLMASASFDPTAFCIKGGMVVNHAEGLQSARMQTEDAQANEDRCQQEWQQGRYQNDWLDVRYRNTEREVRRKDQERAMAEAATTRMLKPREAGR